MTDLLINDLELSAPKNVDDHDEKLLDIINDGIGIENAAIYHKRNWGNVVMFDYANRTFITNDVINANLENRTLEVFYYSPNQYSQHGATTEDIVFGDGFKSAEFIAE